MAQQREAAAAGAGVQAEAEGPGAEPRLQGGQQRARAVGSAAPGTKMGACTDPDEMLVELLLRGRPPDMTMLLPAPPAPGTKGLACTPTEALPLPPPGTKGLAATAAALEASPGGPREAPVPGGLGTKMGALTPFPLEPPPPPAAAMGLSAARSLAVSSRSLLFLHQCHTTWRAADARQRTQRHSCKGTVVQGVPGCFVRRK